MNLFVFFCKGCEKLIYLVLRILTEYFSFSFEVKKNCLSELIFVRKTPTLQPDDRILFIHQFPMKQKSNVLSLRRTKTMSVNSMRLFSTINSPSLPTKGLNFL